MAMIQNEIGRGCTTSPTSSSTRLNLTPTDPRYRRLNVIFFCGILKNGTWPLKFGEECGGLGKVTGGKGFDRVVGGNEGSSIAIGGTADLKGQSRERG